MKEVYNLFKSDIGLIDMLSLKLIAPTYLAESLGDFVINRHKIKRGANTVEAFFTNNFPLDKAIIYLSQITYKGMDEKGMVILEDMSGELLINPWNRSEFKKNADEQGLHKGQKSNILLTYCPKNKSDWLWDFILPQIPKTKGVLGFSLEFVSNNA